MRKLKTSEIKAYREEVWSSSNGICPLCNELIEPDECVLDHSHTSGLIRKPLHRGCNALLGKIENSMKLNKITPAKLEAFAKNLIRYITTAETMILHPTHLTPEERKAKAKKRAQRKRTLLKKNK